MPRVVHRVVCHNAFRLIVVLTARVQFAREPREIAARPLSQSPLPSRVVSTSFIASS